MATTAKPGAALQAAFERRGCALGADEARALAVSLRDLISKSLLVSDTSDQTHTASNRCVSQYTKEGMDEF